MTSLTHRIAIAAHIARHGGPIESERARARLAEYERELSAAARTNPIQDEEDNMQRFEEMRFAW